MINPNNVLIAVGVGAAGYLGYKLLSGGDETSEEASFIGGGSNTFAGEMTPAGDTIYNINVESPDVPTNIFEAAVSSAVPTKKSSSSSSSSRKTSNSPFISDAAETAAKSSTVNLSPSGGVPISLNKSTGKVSYGAFAVAAQSKKEEKTAASLTKVKDGKATYGAFSI